MRDERKRPFFIIDKPATAAIRAGFEGRRVPVALAIYSGLVEAANDARTDRLKAPRSVVARYAGVTPKALDDYVPDLVRIGLLRVERRREHGVHQPNVWVLTDPPEVATQGSHPPRAVPTGSHPGFPRGSHAGLPQDQERDQEQGQESPPAPQGAEAQGSLLAASSVPERPSLSYQRKKITSQEWRYVERIVEEFNRIFAPRPALRPYDPDTARRIVGTLRRFPDAAEMTVEQHVEVMQRNAAAPWWKCPADSVGVIYSPGGWPVARRCTGVPTTRQQRENEGEMVDDALDRLANASDAEVAGMRLGF
jgi:hypothetical protein